MRVIRCLFRWLSPRVLRRRKEGLLSKVWYWHCFQLHERQPPACIPLKHSTKWLHQNHRNCSNQLHTMSPSSQNELPNQTPKGKSRLRATPQPGSSWKMPDPLTILKNEQHSISNNLSLWDNYSIGEDELEEITSGLSYLESNLSVHNASSAQASIAPLHWKWGASATQVDHDPPLAISQCLPLTQRNVHITNQHAKTKEQNPLMWHHPPTCRHLHMNMLGNHFLKARSCQKWRWILSSAWDNPNSSMDPLTTACWLIILGVHLLMPLCSLVCMAKANQNT